MAGPRVDPGLVRNSPLSRPRVLVALPSMSTFSTRWSVLQMHDVGPTDRDPGGTLRDEMLRRWITDAAAAYVEQCSRLESTRARAGLRVRFDIGELPGAADLGQPGQVSVSASATEVFPTSFVVSFRIRGTGGESDATINAACRVVLEDPATGRACELDREIRDELIALEHAARHFN